jgi:hypothetical protein
MAFKAERFQLAAIVRADMRDMKKKQRGASTDWACCAQTHACDSCTPASAGAAGFTRSGPGVSLAGRGDEPELILIQLTVRGKERIRGERWSDGKKEKRVKKTKIVLLQFAKLCMHG